MALPNLPAWSILPDWREGVLERLEWRTSVLASRTGAEQRMALRLAPRRSFEARMTLIGRERALFDLGVTRVGRGEWWLPVWHDGTRLSSDLVLGAGSVPVDAAGRSFLAPGAALLRGLSAFEYEVVEVAAVAADALTLAAGTVRQWPAGTRLYPLRRAYLPEMPKTTRKGDNAALAQCQFMQAEAEDWPGASLPTAYLGYPVLEAHPDETKDLTGEYSRMLAEIDNGSGLPQAVDRAGQGFTLQQFTWFAHGVQSHADIRSLLYTLQGRLTPLWLPTQFADLVLASAAQGDADAIDVTRCGFTAFGGPQPGREHIRIELRDGTALQRRVLASADTSGGNERLALSAALGSDISPSAVRRISFLSLHRLDQDAVEIAHQTDSRGVSTIVASFRSTPESRNAGAWEPVPLAFPVQTATRCGGGCVLVATGPRLVVADDGSPFLTIEPTDDNGGYGITYNAPASGTADRQTARVVWRNGTFNSPQDLYPPAVSRSPGEAAHFVYLPATEQWVIVNTYRDPGTDFGVFRTMSGVLFDGATFAAVAPPQALGIPETTTNGWTLIGAVPDAMGAGFIAAVVDSGNRLWLVRYNAAFAIVQSVVVASRGGDEATNPDYWTNFSSEGRIARQGGTIIVTWARRFMREDGTAYVRPAARVYDLTLSPAGGSFDLADMETGLPVELVGAGVRPHAGGFAALYRVYRPIASGDNNFDIGALYRGLLDAAGQPIGPAVKLYEIEFVAGQTLLEREPWRWDIRAGEHCADFALTETYRWLDAEGTLQTIARLALFNAVSFSESAEPVVIDADPGLAGWASAGATPRWLRDGSLLVGYRITPPAGNAAAIAVRRFALLD